MLACGQEREDGFSGASRLVCVTDTVLKSEPRLPWLLDKKLVDGNRYCSPTAANHDPTRTVCTQPLPLIVSLLLGKDLYRSRHLPVQNSDLAQHKSTFISPGHDGTARPEPSREHGTMSRRSWGKLVIPLFTVGFILYVIRQYMSIALPAIDMGAAGGQVQAWHEDRWVTADGTPANRTLEKAALVMLVRNEELHPARFSIRGIEDRFNKRFGYDWVFLNDQPFSEDFMKYTSALASGAVYYGIIPKEHWSYPKWIDQKKAKQNMRKMEEDDIIYGGSESYRHMCRFNSGFFFEHELMQKYDYYFRIEPFVEFYCDMYEDPFKFMRENKKKYGWVISMYEYDMTIPTLWQTTKDFAKKFPQYIAKYNSLGFIRDDDSALQNSDYNLCHFWSNFEIADLSFLRSQAYKDYFEYLDRAGGFFYERWGDAPVHSLAAALFLDNDEIHHFDDVGYRHNPYTRCPTDAKYHDNGQCSCNMEESFDTDGYSCKHQWDRSVIEARKAKQAGKS